MSSDHSTSVADRARAWAVEFEAQLRSGASAGASGHPLTLDEAREWCRHFAARHSENFVIASRLVLPREKQDEYFALYAFARGVDDAADESAGAEFDPQDRLEHLEHWRRWLGAMYASGAESEQAGLPAVFVALAPVVAEHGIERDLFERMIEAFRQDQVVHRYETWRELRGYTRGSADPVGRWVLRLHDLHSPRLDRLSDSICTGLQVVNFVQDAREDLVERDRVYLPLEDLERFGVRVEDLRQSPPPEPVRELLSFETERAERLLERGRPLLREVPDSLRRQLILFHGGGRLALENLRRAGFDVTRPGARPGKLARIALLRRAMMNRPL